MSGPAQSKARSAGPLEGIQVLEVNRLQPGAFCTMLLGDMGADVLRIEPARKIENDPGDRSGDAKTRAANWLDRNKRAMTLDMKAPEGRKIFHRLAETADVVVEGFRPGVMDRLGAGYETLAEINPGVVYCSLSGFGQDGPYRDRPGHDLDYLALAGVLGLMTGSEGRPAIPFNLVADYAGASMHGALGIMFALFARERTGRGQHVDVSYLDATLSLMSGTPMVTDWLTDGVEPEVGEGIFSGDYPYYATYVCADGASISLGCTEPWLWQNLCELLDRPHLADVALQRADLNQQASARHIAAREELAAVFATKPAAQWFELLGEHNISSGKVLSVPEVFDDPHVRHRQMALELDHEQAGPVVQPGVAIKLSETPGGFRTFAPRRSEDTAAVLSDLGYDESQVSALAESGVVDLEVKDG